MNTFEEILKDARYKGFINELSTEELKQILENIDVVRSLAKKSINHNESIKKMDQAYEDLVMHALRELASISLRNRSKETLISWGEGLKAYVHTFEELEKLLDKIGRENQKSPPIVDIEGSGEFVFSIGVGRDMTVLSTTPKHTDPPYYISLGNKDAEGLIVFYYNGQYTDFPNKYAIPYQVGRDIAREYFETGILSKQIKWEES